ncbi:MAG TPA: hypothetical protein QF644_02020 [Candidatus Poseidoniaceae archaeon]|jgi:hypothetical protein|nr:hypothetical protein [Candidatus Poseidoniaceae archaeon]
MPRRKYGKLRKVVEVPNKEKCSRCRSGKYCPIPGHLGNKIVSSKTWKGPETTSKRAGKK